MNSLSLVRKFAAPVLAVAVAGLLTVSAHAAPMLRLTQNGDTVLVGDGTPGDFMGLPGAVTFIGSLGVFDLNVSTGATKPYIGTSAKPELDLSSINAASTGAGTIKIEFTETDFTNPGATLDLVSTLAADPDTSMQFQTYASLTNMAFATDIQIADTGVLSAGEFFSDLSTIALQGAYSLTLVVTITHDQAGQLSSFDARLQVPEPGLSPALLIGALVVSARIASRRKRARA